MDRRQNPISLLAAVFLFSCASPTCANTIAPTAYFFPGVLPLMLGLALPASLLAAVLERPFVLRAGVSEFALWYSLQANLVSLIIGYVTLPVGVYAIYAIGPIWSLVAVAMSVLSEGWYYQWRAITSGNAQWRWIVIGNLFSSFVVLLLPSVALAIKEANPSLVWAVDPYQGVLFRTSVGASALGLGGSFFAPRIMRRMRSARSEAPRQSPAPLFRLLTFCRSGPRSR